MTNILEHKSNAMAFQISLYMDDRDKLRYLKSYFRKQGRKTSYSELIRTGIRLTHEAVEKEKLNSISK
jgi:hypothetical protein